MLDTPRQMYRGTLLTSTSTVAATPSGVVWVVRNIIVSNTTGTAASFTLTFAGTALLTAVSVPAYGVLTFDIAQVLVGGSIVTASASVASSINLFIAGIEVVV